MARGSRKAALPAAIAVVALLTFTGLAAATAPVRGGHYKGHLSASDQTNVRVTFTVYADGKSVRDMHVGPFPPDTCGGGGPVPHQTSSTVPIRNGTFTAHITYHGVTGSVIYRMTVTGQFLAHGKERGVVEGRPTDDPKCGGNFKYATTAH